MIIKSFEINKINLKKINFLFYGKNEGFKNEIISKLIKDKRDFTHTYEEKEILENTNTFLKMHFLNLFLRMKK